MAGLTAAGADLLLEGARTGFTHLTLHTADPGSGGSDEVANTGAYARQAAPWDASPTTDGSDRRLDTQSDVVFQGPAVQVQVTHIGYADSGVHGGGNFLNSFALPTPKDFGPGDELTFSTDDIALKLGLTA